MGRPPNRRALIYSYSRGRLFSGWTAAAIVWQVLFALVATYTYSSVAAATRQPEEPPTLPVIQAEPLLPLTPEKLQLVALTARLSLYTYRISVLSKLLYGIDEVDYEADGAIVLQGGNDDTGFLPLDRVLLYDKDSYCFVAYMGTFVSVDEWSQNLNLTVVPVASRDDASQTCQFRGGFVEAYHNSQPNQVASWIDQCMSTSLNHNTDENNHNHKQLVLTGHSQGGSIALVAALVHERYNPLIITVGQPPALTQPSCNGIVDDHVWRFINTENDEGLIFNHMNYDLVREKVNQPLWQSKQCCFTVLYRSLFSNYCTYP